MGTVAKLGALWRLSMGMWKQGCTDATTRGGCLMQGLAMTILEDDVWRPVVLSACIILLKGEKSSAVVNALLSTVNEGGKLMDDWIELTETMFPDFNHGLRSSFHISLAKLINGFVTTDTCNPANKFNKLLQRKVKELAKEWLDDDRANEYKRRDKDENEIEWDLTVYEIMCWHHLRNIWFKHGAETISTFIAAEFPDYMAAFEAEDRVSAYLPGVMRATEKYFGLTCQVGARSFVATHLVICLLF